MTPHAVAVIADAHFHAIEGDFGGVGVTVAGRRLALRSWTDTAGGARAVNESGAALRAALDRIVREGVRHVILAGDYTDDGQAENTRRLADLLQGYRTTHGLRFYAIPGNHDAFGPAGRHVSTRFMTGPATSAPVTSDPGMAGAGDAIATPAMRCEGLPAALLPMARFGLFRQPGDLHWESPFGPSDAPGARLYDAAAADGSVSHRLMDASYLVEPEPGLWLMLIDATVFEPRPGRLDPSRKKAFLDPSTAGWDAVLRVKPYLLPWIADVVARAASAGRTLVTVSHYPVLDPFQDAAGSEAALFGATTLARRTPSPAVAGALIAAGLRWHAGGHMHVNATTRLSTAGGGLTDVALPSIVAFPPAFGVVRASPDAMRTEIVVLDDVRFDPRIVESYRSQGRTGGPADYLSFLGDQFERRILDHVLPRDWPAALWAWIKGADCAQLVRLLGADPAVVAAEGGLAQGVLSDHPVARLIVDAHLIRAAGPLARDIVGPGGIRICRTLGRAFGDATAVPGASDADFIRRFLSVVRVTMDRMSSADAVVGQGA